MHDSCKCDPSIVIHVDLNAAKTLNFLAFSCSLLSLQNQCVVSFHMSRECYLSLYVWFAERQPLQKKGEWRLSTSAESFSSSQMKSNNSAVTRQRSSLTCLWKWGISQPISSQSELCSADTAEPRCSTSPCLSLSPCNAVCSSDNNTHWWAQQE